MAEKTILVCDTCGRPAVETVTFKTSVGNRQRDYCTADLNALIQGSRAPKRGRKPGSVNKRKPTATRKSAAKKRTVRKSST